MSAYTKGAKRRLRQSRPAPIQPRGLQEVIRPQITVTSSVIEPENLRWHVLRVAPQKEERVVEVFDRVGVPAAVPTVPRERRARGKILRWRSPIAHGYVLAGFPGTGPIPWYDVLRFGIVNSVLCLEGRPVQIPWRTTFEHNGRIKRGGVEQLLPDVEAVRVGAAKFARNWPLFEVDETVRLQAGPFSGFEGKVQDICEQDATILVEIFGRHVPVRIGLGDAVRAA